VLSIPSSYSAEVVAHNAFDWVCIDMQHGVIDYQVAVTMLQAISTTRRRDRARAVERHVDYRPHARRRAMGIIVPMVNSVEEAHTAVSACRYFPAGARSYGRRAPRCTPAPITSTRHRRGGVHPHD